nr:hypothetical protein [Tanacetum cinerariifolium]
YDDLYPVTQQPPVQTPVVLLSFSSTTWHRRLGHPEEDVLRRLESISRAWPIHQLDVKNAFLHGHLSETVYIHHPPGFANPVHPDYVYHLQRLLYGLKQAPGAWFRRFASYATRFGFQHSKTDSSLLIFHRETDIAYLLLYVDDIILTSFLYGLRHACFYRNLNMLRKFLRELTCSIAILVGLRLILNLSWVLMVILFLIPPCIVAWHVLFSILLSHDHIFLMLFNGFVSICKILVSLVLKRIIWYVRGTLDHGLQLHVSTTTQLTPYTDADWAGCPLLGIVFSLGIIYYHGLLNEKLLYHVLVQRLNIRVLLILSLKLHGFVIFLLELHAPLHTATLVYSDNVCAVYLSTNLVQHQRTKHFEIDIHFVRDYVAFGQVCILHIPSRFQYADIITKGLPSALFIEFRSSLNVLRPLIPTAGKY